MVTGLVGGLGGCLAGIVMAIAMVLPPPGPSTPVLPTRIELTQVVEPPEQSRPDDDLVPCGAVVYLEPGEECAQD